MTLVIMMTTILHVIFLISKQPDISALYENPSVTWTSERWLILFQLDHEDQLYMEAFEQMLQSWVCILQESSSCNSAQVKQSATLIFDTYLKCHLAPPEGSRVAVSEWFCCYLSLLFSSLVLSPEAVEDRLYLLVLFFYHRRSSPAQSHFPIL